MPNEVGGSRIEGIRGYGTAMGCCRHFRPFCRIGKIILYLFSEIRRSIVHRDFSALVINALQEIGSTMNEKAMCSSKFVSARRIDIAWLPPAVDDHFGMHR